MSQNLFTLSFPLQSPATAKALAAQLPPLMTGLYRASDTIGRVHYSRFTVLSERTLLFLGDFDGEFGQLMTDLAKDSKTWWPPTVASPKGASNILLIMTDYQGFRHHSGQRDHRRS